MRCLILIVARPVRDWLDALETCLQGRARVGLAVLIASMLLSWWAYVPAHELLHAWGCRLAGGTVTRLEIDGIYGAALLAKLFPYVTSGSRYAGRLSGFDTRGSDLVYLATDAAPFVLTIVIGVPLLRAAARRGGPWRCAMLGASVPLAFAPFVSLPGDYYEMGAVIVSRAVARVLPGVPLDRWRSDDLLALVGHLAGTAGAGDVAALTASLLVGIVLAFATYWAGIFVASALGARDGL